MLIQMIEFLNTKISTRQLLWLVPIFLTLHNLEEALTMPHWVPAHLPFLQSKFFFFRYLHFSSPQLFLSLSSVTIFPLLLSRYAIVYMKESRRIKTMFVLQSIIFWNAFVPHLAGALLLGMYNPGTITAVVITIPFSFYFFHRTVHDKLIDCTSRRKLLLLGGGAYLPVVYLNHVLAAAVIKFL
jgi:hypothetical protein